MSSSGGKQSGNNICCAMDNATGGVNQINANSVKQNELDSSTVVKDSSKATVNSASNYSKSSVASSALDSGSKTVSGKPVLSWANRVNRVYNTKTTSNQPKTISTQIVPHINSTTMHKAKETTRA
jgi:hypothetical protein